MAAQQAIALIALAMILLFGFSAIDAAYVSTGDYHNVTNESFTSDPGNWVELENSNIDGAVYYDNETVYNSTGAEMADGTDYEYNRSTGEVKALSGGGLDPAQNANITYNYSTFSEAEAGANSLLVSLLEPANSLLIVLAVITILAGAKFLTGGV